jgi:hypothetical protein
MHLNILRSPLIPSLRKEIITILNVSDDDESEELIFSAITHKMNPFIYKKQHLPVTNSDIKSNARALLLSRLQAALADAPLDDSRFKNILTVTLGAVSALKKRKYTLYIGVFSKLY